MGDMTKCKHGGSVGYCDICSPQDVILNLRERLADAEAALAERDAEIARLRALFNLTRADIQLMAGELSAGEWRTVSAILKGLQTEINAGVAAARKERA